MKVTLSGSVGFKGKNQRADVEAVQGALKEVARLTGDARLDPGPGDGAAGAGTGAATERLQRRAGIRKPDARLDPGGYSVGRLNALLAIGEVAMTYPFSTTSAHPFVGAGAGMRA